jgi:uncharacterized membrane protein
MSNTNSKRSTACTLSLINLIFSYICFIIPGIIWHIFFHNNYKIARIDNKPHTCLAIFSIIMGGPLGLAAGILLLTSDKK